MESAWEEPVKASEMYRCNSCGAPLEVSPETIVAICSYCGYPNWIREDLKEAIFVVEALPEKKIVEKAWERIRTDKDLKKLASFIQVGRPFAVYVPFYFSDASAMADYDADVVVRIRKCRGSGKERRCWTETHRVHVSGVYGPYTASYPVVARRGVRAFSVQVLGHYYLKHPVKAKKIEEIKFTRTKARRILGVEIDKKTASDIVLNEHLNVLRDKVTSHIKSEAESKAMIYGGVVEGSTILRKRITPRNVKVRVSNIILLPLFIIPYYVRRELYRFFISGWDGETIVAEEPMNLLTRMLWGTGGTILAGLLGGAGASIISTSTEAVPLILGGLMIAAGAYTSYYSMKIATRPVKVEVVGERFRAIKKFLGAAEKVKGLPISLDGIAGIIGAEAISIVLSRD